MKKYENTGSKDTRSGFGAGMTELGQKNENVVALCADLIGSLKFDDFKKFKKHGILLHFLFLFSCCLLYALLQDRVRDCKTKYSS